MNRPKPQLESTEKADPANAISVAQLCSLTGYSPASISNLKDVLPNHFAVPTGNPQGGKPMHMFRLDELASFILSETSFLTDAECRLRVALSANLRKRKSPMARFLDAHSMLEIDGELRVLPRDHGALTPELRAKVETFMAQEQAALRTRRSTKRQPRSTHTQPEVSPS